MKKEITYEIYWLRCIACLAVVGIHAISSGFHLFTNVYSGGDISFSQYMLQVFQMSLLFGTPTFVFISEFLLSKNYPDGLPDGFFKKRIKYLLIPYFCMAIVYGIVFSESSSFSTISANILNNAFLGDFVAYFILIIFQFYIMHHLLNNKLKMWNPLKVILISLFINIAYLAFFVLIQIPENEIYHYFRRKGHWLLFPAWIFYFSLGYYSGKHYEKVMVLLNKYKLVVFLLPFLSLLVVLGFTEIGFGITSKRIDILFYTASIVSFILLVTSKSKQTPSFVLFIGKYAFSIYLLHKLLIDNVGRITDNIFVHVISTFVLGLIFSIVIAKLFNLIPLGKYIVGQTGKTPSRSKTVDVKR